jgi:TonB family protein
LDLRVGPKTLSSKLSLSEVHLPETEEVAMKRCDACGEGFKDKFSSCPVDGKPLSEVVARGHEFKLTIVSDLGLIQRLAIELEFVLDQIKRSWPSFKRNPIAFSGNELRELKKLLRKTLARPHVLSGSLSALLIVCAIILGVLLLEKHSPRTTGSVDESDVLTRTVEIDLRRETKSTNDAGEGVGEKGRVGFENGRGEGSRPVPAKARGGGGGGTHNQSEASQGRPPQPSEIPAPISTTLARLPPQALSVAGIDIDPALWKNLSFTAYGDPRSKSTTPSNGPGSGGGVGTGNGTGIGEGDGAGFGRGRDGNTGGDSKAPGSGGKGGSPGGDNPDDPNRVYTPPQVTERARVLSKPEPQYTEEARRADITGTVILRVVFSKTGEVTNIRALQPLGAGLTEKAIAAARQIRFVPARRNGQAVSMYMQLEYNFNLY